MLYKSSYSLNTGGLFILPTGSIEQHDDLPLGTDSIIAECISWRIHDKLRERGYESIVMPPIYYGFSPEWKGVKGTISLGREVFCGLITSIMESLSRHMVSKLLIVNGHGGNSNILKTCVADAVDKVDSFAVMIVDYYRFLRNTNLGHACQVERSMLEYCGVTVAMQPSNPINKEYSGIVISKSNISEPISIIPSSGSRYLTDKEIEGSIDDIIEETITFIQRAGELAFPNK